MTRKKNVDALSAKARRLSEALRANLQKRKSQSRSRRVVEDGEQGKEHQDAPPAKKPGQRFP